MYSPKRNVLIRSELYAFGNSSPRDILDDFHLDGCDGDMIKILYLGCGDLRNALYTLAQRSPKNTNTFLLHVNDINTVIVARNILILKVISDSFNKERDLEYVIDLWYNFIWFKEETQLRFISDVAELINSDLPEHLVVSDASQMLKLKTIWARWLSLASSTEYLDQNHSKKLIEKRLSIFMNSLPIDETTMEQEFKINMDFWIKLSVGENSSLTSKAKDEVETFIASGNLSFSGAHCHCVNPTLLEPFTDECNVHSTCFPYFLMRTPKVDDENVAPATRFRCTLSWMIESYRRQKDRVKFFFDIGDALDYCFTMPIKFDVIDSSNLADHVGLANMIIAGFKILADRETSILYTQSMSWGSLRSVPVDYIETALGVPVSMIPNIYGLQLATRLELGSTKITSISDNVGSIIDFMWRRAPALDVPFDAASPEFQKCLVQLHQRCFVLNERAHWKEEDESIGTMAYTPLTVNYLLTSLEKRLRLINVPPVEVHPVFQLTQRALTDWSKGYPVSLVKWTFKYVEEQFTLNWCEMFLRVTLVPPSSLTSVYKSGKELMDYIMNPTAEVGSKFHFIDNFQFNMIQQEGKTESVEISFLLPIDHGLHPTYACFLVYATKGIPIFLSDQISDCFAQEKFSSSHPYLMKRRLEPAPTSEIVADSCLETKADFTISCRFSCEDGGALNVDTDQSSPSESCHRILLSFAKFRSKVKKTLKITLPHPVWSSTVHASISRKQKTISILAVKALQEPWPVEFSAIQQKWDVSDLRQWPKNEDRKAHFTAQLSLDHLMKRNRSFDPANPLKGIRTLIATIFEECWKKNHHMFAIKDSQNQELWTIRAFKPILKSDTGSPILPILALDAQLVERLRGAFDPNVAFADHERIFGSETHGCIIHLDSQVEVDILRYVLRLNSTRMSWKKNQLAPRLKNSMILTTFLSPLYEVNVSKERWNEKIVPTLIDALKQVGMSSEPSAGAAGSQKQPCHKCGQQKGSMRRCSRCKKIYYCSSDCQRADWRQHRKNCVV